MEKLEWEMRTLQAAANLGWRSQPTTTRNTEQSDGLANLTQGKSEAGCGSGELKVTGLRKVSRSGWVGCWSGGLLFGLLQKRAVVGEALKDDREDE